VTEYPLHRILGGHQCQCGRVRKISSPTNIRSPERPDRSQSLFLLSYPGPQTNTSSITSGQNATAWTHCRERGHTTWSALMLKGVRLRSRLLATRRLVIGLFFLRIYPPVTSHRSVSVPTSDVVCVRTHRHQTSRLLWAAKNLLVSVSKLPGLSAQQRKYVRYSVTAVGKTSPFSSNKMFILTFYISTDVRAQVSL
jgi:hypothetical protein